MKHKNLLIVFMTLCFITLTAVIVWASVEKNVWIGVDHLLAERWGIATLVDVYISFTLLAILMGIWERSWLIGIILAVATYMLGSLVPLVYLIIKLKKQPGFLTS